MLTNNTHKATSYIYVQYIHHLLFLLLCDSVVSQRDHQSQVLGRSINIDYRHQRRYYVNTSRQSLALKIIFQKTRTLNARED